MRQRAAVEPDQPVRRGVRQHACGVRGDLVLQLARGAGLNIPTGIPLRYDLDADMRPLVAGGSYLDPDAAAAGAAAVASQGAK